MSNVGNYAKLELEILERVSEDADILPFKEEIVALAEAFGNSGQSGGSAPYVATAISQAVKKLLLFEPITEITGIDEEWSKNSLDKSGTLQNRRCSALFKYPNGEHYYIDAIVFKGEREHDTFTGRVYVDKTFKERIGSSQMVKGFPFKPKTFYLDVEYIPVTKEYAEGLNLHYIENGDRSCYISVLKDEKQLEAVRKYYNLKLYKNG